MGLIAVVGMVITAIGLIFRAILPEKGADDLKKIAWGIALFGLVVLLIVGAGISL